jgi:riboflavin transporter
MAFFVLKKGGNEKMETKKMKKTYTFKTKQIVLMAMFIALAFVGSFIKIPSPFGTVALDSAPAFIAAMLLGLVPGAIVAFMGHLLTSLNVGFPLTIPIHLLIATEMGLICALVGIIFRKRNLIMALVVALLLNGVAAPASFILIPQFGLPFFSVMLIPILVGSAVNLIIVAIVVRTLKGRI